MTTMLNARVLILGASGGLGSEIAKECEHRGGHVLAITHTGSITETTMTVMAADITESESRERIVEAVQAMGGIDVVIVASGVVGFGMHDAVDADSLKHLIDVDLVAPLSVLSLISPHISEGGNITVITGAVVDMPTLGVSSYTAAKAGLSAAAAVIRRELRSRRISVLDARPPHTETGLANRAVFGTAPQLKAGLEPSAVARRIVDAIEAGETELTPASFAA
jgi:cyclic-di-GMP-binding biofilm dispersal mediator protein